MLTYNDKSRGQLSYKTMMSDDDIVPAFEICLEAAKNYPLPKGLEHDEEAVLQTVESFFQDNLHNQAMFIAYDDKEPVGVLACIKVPFHIILGSNVAMELVWYVKPSHRGTEAGLKLLEGYETWASNIGCKALSVASLGNDKISKKLHKLYLDKGYSKVETSYMKGMV